MVNDRVPGEGKPWAASSEHNPQFPPPGDKPPRSLAIREAISEILVGAQFVVRFSGEAGFSSLSSLVESLLHIGRGFDCFIVAGIDPVQKDVSI